MTGRQTMYFLLTMVLIAWALPRFAPLPDVGEAPAEVSEVAPRAKKIAAPVKAETSPQDPADAAFTRLADETLAKLPRRALLQNRKDSELHQAPPELLASVSAFASIREAVEKNPALAKAAVAFYRSCALDEEVFAAVRANCLFHLKETAPSAHLAYDPREYPDDIIRLVGIIPPR
jgi:hypothetical protein